MGVRVPPLVPLFLPSNPTQACRSIAAQRARFARRNREPPATGNLCRVPLAGNSSSPTAYAVSIPASTSPSPMITLTLEPAQHGSLGDAYTEGSGHIINLFSSAGLYRVTEQGPMQTCRPVYPASKSLE